MIGIGVIACGKIAQVRHLPEYADNPHVQIRGLFDLQPDRAEKYLLYGSLLLGLYLLSGQTHYVIYGLLCLSLMTACRVRNAKTKGP